MKNASIEILELEDVIKELKGKIELKDRLILTLTGNNKGKYEIIQRKDDEILKLDIKVHNLKEKLKTYKLIMWIFVGLFIISILKYVL